MRATHMADDPAKRDAATQGAGRIPVGAVDGGQKWTRSNVIDLGRIGNHGGVTESTLEQLADGRLRILPRTNWGPIPGNVLRLRGADRHYNTRQAVAFAGCCREIGADLFMVMPTRLGAVPLARKRWRHTTR